MMSACLVVLAEEPESWDDAWAAEVSVEPAEAEDIVDEADATFVSLGSFAILAEVDCAALEKILDMELIETDAKAAAAVPLGPAVEDDVLLELTTM